MIITQHKYDLKYLHNKMFELLEKKKQENNNK